MDFLLEVGCEEIPARFVPPALSALAQQAQEGLRSARLDAGGSVRIKTQGTPRRLVLHILGVPQAQTDVDEDVMGPRVDVAYDKEGNPTPACLGFLKSKGGDLSQLKKIDGPKGQVVALHRTLKGKATAEVLPSIVVEMLTRLSFPKTMRWGEGEIGFCRPVHWLVALLDDQVLPFSFAGIQSGRRSRGHRFAAGSSIDIANIDSFQTSLREKHVVLDPEQRRQTLHEEAHRLARETGGTLVEDPGLEEEVTFLTECPVPVLGRFDEKYLQLPRAVLIAAMRNHQRYFAVERADGQLQNAFVAIGNNPVADAEAVRHGYERVLAARLADARFFFDVDQKSSLAERVPQLQEVVFQADLGTYYEKANRVANLAVGLASRTKLGSWESLHRVVEVLVIETGKIRSPQEWFSWRVARAALLCKTDLLTEMVREFPELQGLMGGVYAHRMGEDEKVAAAIRDHYHPRFAGDTLPETEEGAILSLAERFDTLAGCFGVGLKPTGGADPYALRRQCLAIIAIVLNRGFRFSLSAILKQAVTNVYEKVETAKLRQLQHKAQKAAKKGEKGPIPQRVEPFDQSLVEELLSFFDGRLRQRFSESASSDIVDAVLSSSFDDLVGAQERIKALDGFSKQPEFQNLAVAFKRAANIIKDFKGATLDPSLLKEPQEQQLHQAVMAITPKYEVLITSDQFSEAMELLGASLRTPIDHFFEKVLVNDPNDVPRQQNRKALLKEVVGLFGRLADFTKLQTKDDP